MLGYLYIFKKLSTRRVLRPLPINITAGAVMSQWQHYIVITRTDYHPGSFPEKTPFPLKKMHTAAHSTDTVRHKAFIKLCLVDASLCKGECSHLFFFLFFFFSFFSFFFFFTFEQEIVFIVSVPHSRRGRCSACLRKRMCGKYGYEFSLYARKIW